ncbi:MAG TPA: hypothetical protein VGE51_07525 [Fontimonas sp.]
MDDKALYQKKQQAQLDEYKAEIDKLKAKASKASADVQLEVNKQIRALETKLDEGRSKLAELAEATGEAWDELKSGVDSAWQSLKKGVSDAGSRLTR